MQLYLEPTTLGQRDSAALSHQHHASATVTSSPFIETDTGLNAPSRSTHTSTAKMLLAEDPATLIHHTIDNFNIQPDKQACARINESLSTLQQARDLRAREAENALKSASPPSPHMLRTVKLT